MANGYIERISSIGLKKIFHGILLGVYEEECACIGEYDSTAISKNIDTMLDKYDKINTELSHNNSNIHRFVFYMDSCHMLRAAETLEGETRNKMDEMEKNDKTKEEIEKMDALAGRYETITEITLGYSKKCDEIIKNKSG